MSWPLQVGDWRVVKINPKRYGRVEEVWRSNSFVNPGEQRWFCRMHWMDTNTHRTHAMGAVAASTISARLMFDL